jgi:hypothetical protein
LAASTILVTSKRVSLVGLPFVVLGFLLLYPVLPIALLSFYRSRAAQSAFRDADAAPSWLSDTPESVRVAASLLGLLALFLHFPLLFRGSSRYSAGQSLVFRELRSLISRSRQLSY